jgi:hypothetical protein
VLAYVFWHRPRAGVGPAGYEADQLAFQHSLAHNPPAGLLANAALRLARCPWLGPAGDGDAPAYEDWYLLEDWTALGVLERAAVGAGHRSRHDRVAGKAGGAAGAVYYLVDGAGAATLAAPTATWVQAPLEVRAAEVGELLVDGVDRARASLWRRALVLGPAPEHCVLAPQAPAGASGSRLSPGWSAVTLARETLFAPGA